MRQIRHQRADACAWLVLGLWMLCACAQAAAAEVRASNQAAEVKAAHVVNFIRYTDWPPESFAHRRDPYVIAVVAPGWFTRVLRAKAKAIGHVRQRPLQVRTLRIPPGSDQLPEQVQRDLDGAHVLIVHAAFARLHEPLLDAVRRAAVLTIGTGDGFTDAGGMLGLVRTERSIVFEANPEAMHAAGLRMSSKVLRLARSDGREAR